MAIKFINDRTKRYLILLPAVFLLANAMFFQYATRKIKETMLQEKIVEITDAVDALAAAVDANPDRIWYEHELNIIGSAEYLDSRYQVFCGAYKPIDGELVLITERFYETSIFEPLDYPDFTEAIHRQESGSLIIGYAPENQTYRELHLYFRWMPLYSAAGERYLVVAGVSLYSIVTQIPTWISAGQWVSIAVTFALNVWLILMIARLGNFYERCEDCKRTKETQENV